MSITQNSNVFMRGYFILSLSFMAVLTAKAQTSSSEALKLNDQEYFERQGGDVDRGAQCHCQLGT